ncbi:MAG: helix-turn-helix transcriptional regulator [Pseudomonadota bacterium]
MPKDHFANNLRLLCNEVSSVAEVCRAIEVNRQQFNKYLAGNHRPSPYNLTRICRYFGVEEFEILLPPEKFANVLTLYQDRRRRAAGFSLEALIGDTFPGNMEDLQRYEGYYHSHFSAFGWEDRIVRSLICFHVQEGRMFVKDVERFTDAVLGQSYTMKSDGLVTMFANRLYIAERQSLAGGKISLTILNATHQTRITLLSGLTMGTSTHKDHLPSASRVIYKYLGKNIDKRQALDACGAFAPNDKRLDKNLVELVSNEIAPDEKVLFGRLV